MRFVSIVLVIFLLVPQGRVDMAFASTWNPTKLVNTEAFQVIDDANTTANVVLRFGDTLNKNLTYDRTAARFSFDAGVYVGGNAWITGTLSGNLLHTEKGVTSSGSINVWGGRPGLLGTYNTTGSSLSVTIVGRYAYVADSGSGLVIIDTTKPASPSLVGVYDTTGSAKDVVVMGRYAYVADGSSGLHIIDISNPASPILIGTHNMSGAFDIALIGQYAYITNGAGLFEIVDISNPASPTRISNYNTAEVVLAVTVSGRYAYLSAGAAGLQIVDISNPASPSLVGTYNTAGGALGATVAGRYAYVADDTSGLQIVDISNPASPSLVGTYNTAGNALGITIAGRYAYVADGSSGLQIIDISNPASPLFIGSYDTSGTSQGIFVSGTYAYIGDQTSGLQVINLQGIDAPSAKIGAIETSQLSVLNDARINANLIVDRSLDVGDGLYVFGQSAMRAFSGSALTVSTQDRTGKPALTVIGTLSGTTLHAEKTISSSGALTWEGAGSGSSLYLGTSLQGAGLTTCSNGTTSKLLWDNTTGRFSCGTDQTGGGSSSFGTGNVLTIGNQKYVSKQGDTMTGALTINIQGGTLGSVGLKVLNTLSGAIIHAEKTLTSSGQLMVKQTGGTSMGSGALTVVNTTRYGTGGYMVSSGTVLALDSSAQNHAPAKSPHLLFGYKGNFDVNLYRSSGARLQTDQNFWAVQTISGALVHGEKTLSSSGTLVWEGAASGATLKVSGAASFDGPLTFGDAISDAITINSSTWTFTNDTNFVLSGGVNGLSFDTSTFSVDAENNRIGINTIAPNTRLEVVGTISGSLLRASNMTVSGAVVYSSGNTLKQNAKGASGQLLISQATSAPKWATPVGSMVWYLDSTITAGSNQGAIVTMPFGMLASSGSLRIKGAPTGADLIVDIKKNGTTIFSTKPKILAGATIGGKNMVLSTTDLGIGSEITVSVDQVGSTFAGSGLTIMLNGTRKY
jgi:hypothetical protein